MRIQSAMQCKTGCLPYFCFILVTTVTVVFITSLCQYLGGTPDVTSLHECLPIPVIQFSRQDNNYSADVQGRRTQVGKYPTDDGTNSVFRILPWPIERKRYLPNFFTRSPASGFAKYRDGHIVFLHHNKAGGSTVKNILTGFKGKLKIPTVLLSSESIASARELARNVSADSPKEIFMGGYSFGTCDLLPKTRPCSYFTLVRNPYRRVISSYFHCIEKHENVQLCGPLNAADVSIETWALHQGSFLFRQLLLHPDMCSRELAIKKYAASYMKRTHRLFPYTDKIDQYWWFYEKAYFQEKISKEERRVLLDFCLGKIESWFSVVGVLEEFEVSLSMFEAVYGLPFSKYKDVSKNSHAERDSTAKSFYNASMADELQERLENNEEVRGALYEDVMIYRKICEIFYKQREALKGIVQ